MNKNKNLGFTLAEVLIVIGIIGVVAALTLPNLNHATGDKETVTRLRKAYSILSEANDRAVAIYGPISSWKSENCKNDGLQMCYMKRIGEFLKISKSCAEGDACEGSLDFGDCSNDDYEIIYQLTDGMTFCAENNAVADNCDYSQGNLNDICISDITFDINGPQKGKNDFGKDIFTFSLSDTIGIMPLANPNPISYCIHNTNNVCTFWVLEYGNLDYLKADENGKCNDSNIVLDGVTNTSCH